MSAYTSVCIPGMTSGTGGDTNVRLAATDNGSGVMTLSAGQAAGSGYGSVVAALKTGTSVNAGTFGAILIVSAAVFTTLAGMGGDSVSGVTFPAGVTIYGSFTTVTLASGSIVLYS